MQLHGLCFFDSDIFTAACIIRVAANWRAAFSTPPPHPTLPTLWHDEQWRDAIAQCFIVQSCNICYNICIPCRHTRYFIAAEAGSVDSQAVAKFAREQPPVLHRPYTIRAGLKGHGLDIRMSLKWYDWIGPSLEMVRKLMINFFNSPFSNVFNDKFWPLYTKSFWIYLKLFKVDKINSLLLIGRQVSRICTDSFDKRQAVICVRYHCGGWPEEVNSCVLNSYMVYL